MVPAQLAKDPGIFLCVKWKKQSIELIMKDKFLLLVIVNH